MKKLDLRTGMKIILENKDEYIVLLNVEHNYKNNQTVNVLINPKLNFIWDDLDYFDDDLSNNKYGLSNIVKVYKPNHPYDIFYESCGWELIWERDKS